MSYDSRNNNKPNPRSMGNTPATLSPKAVPADFLRNADTNINDVGEKFVRNCFEKNKDGKPSVTVSQIRKFLSAVNAIQNKISASENNFNRDEVQYLRIKLAYQAGRENSLKQMRADLDPIISKIETVDDFKKFAQLMEAIVAYHKFYGGSN